MKTTRSALVAGVLLLAGCNIVDDLITFEIENSVEFMVPSSSIVDLPFEFDTPDVNTSSQQSFENNNTRADLVEDVSLSELTLTIIAPDDRTFSF